jgi:hypothetical protein
MILLCGGRRFGGFTSKSSKCSEGLCGGNPSKRNRFALLRISEPWRCNRLAICDTECVGHKVISSRSSSSVQRDMVRPSSRPPAPSAMTADSCGDVLAIASFPQRRSQSNRNVRRTAGASKIDRSSRQRNPRPYSARQTLAGLRIATWCDQIPTPTENQLYPYSEHTCAHRHSQGYGKLFGD